MPSYQAKTPQVSERQLRVQRLSIPFKIVGNATSTSAVLSNDEPSVLFLKTQGVDQVTPAVDSSDTVPTFADPAADGAGVINMLVKIEETLSKVVSAVVIDRQTGNLYRCFVGDSSGVIGQSGTGITQTIVNPQNSKSIYLTCVSAINLLTPSTIDCDLMVEYTTNQPY